MKEALFSLLLAIAFCDVGLGQSQIVLWEAGAPNSLGKDVQDVPLLTPFPAPREIATGAAMVICPGGGYSHLSEIKEGSDVAKWLNSIGISAFVLRYRLGMRYHQPNQLLDAARAMRTVRARAKEWNVDPQKIGVVGFSAGGHLASTLGTHFDSGKADATDPIDRVSSRPDLMVLVYPVITMGEFSHGGSRLNLLGEHPSSDLLTLYSNELQVTKDTPPAFLVHTANDATVPVENSTMFAEALRRNKVPFELHIYERGPHGFGLAPNDPILATWTDRCADWLLLRGFAKSARTSVKKP